MHGRMARVGHKLPKVSLGLAIPYPSTAVSGVAVCRAGSLLFSSTLLDTPHHTALVTWKTPNDVAAGVVYENFILDQNPDFFWV
jgi:hypothetical protein